jgi:hypothetical protein
MSHKITDEDWQLMLKIAHQFPTSDGIADWSEHFMKDPDAHCAILNERTAPALGFLIGFIHDQRRELEETKATLEKVRGPMS